MNDIDKINFLEDDTSKNHLWNQQIFTRLKRMQWIDSLSNTLLSRTNKSSELIKVLEILIIAWMTSTRSAF